MKFRPTISIVLDTRTQLKSGLYPVRLRATFQVILGQRKRWVRKYYDTGYKFTQKQFEGLWTSRIVEMKDAAIELKRIESKALQICRDNAYLDADLFTRLFTGGGGDGVLGMFQKYIDELTEYGQVGTAANYRTAMGSFKAFAGGEFIFHQVTEDFLRKYEKWMKGHKVTRIVNGRRVEVTASCAPATIAIYLRCMRKIFNDAIAAKRISADLYPFGRRQFVIQTTRSPKYALDEREKDALLTYSGPEQEAVDFWVFSYLCNGMNFSDIARLRYSDIDQDMIFLVRGKTASTSRQVKKIEIPMRKEVVAIIRKYGCKTLDPDGYVFGVLDEGLTPIQQKNRIHDFIDRTNQGLRRAAVSLGFKFKLTTYTARHTFSTISLRKGASKEFIQEALGHSSMQTTENYLAGFDRETKRRMNAKL